MIRRPALAVVRALLIAVAIAGAGSVTGTGAIAAGEAPKDAPAQAGAPFDGKTIPLGAPRPVVSVTPPVDRNAFPAEIMARLRAALVDRSGNVRARSDDAQTGND